MLLTLVYMLLNIWQCSCTVWAALRAWKFAGSPWTLAMLLHIIAASGMSFVLQAPRSCLPLQNVASSGVTAWLAPLAALLQATGTRSAAAD
jgi:hypothetical protein